MTDEEFAAILAQRREAPATEFKGPGRLDDGRLVAQVVKAVLGMSNRSGGGNVIIGVIANESTFNPVGLSGEELSTWVYDHVADHIARYADPSVSFEMDVKEYNDARYIVIQVEEFSDIPVLCKRAYSDDRQTGANREVLRAGACYVRTRRKPETTEIPTQTEMRDLLDLAINKGIDRSLRQFLERARQAGLIEYRTAIPPTDQELFNEQIGDLQ